MEKEARRRIYEEVQRGLQAMPPMNETGREAVETAAIRAALLYAGEGEALDEIDALKSNLEKTGTVLATHEGADYVYVTAVEEMAWSMSWEVTPEVAVTRYGYKAGGKK